MLMEVDTHRFRWRKQKTSWLAVAGHDEEQPVPMHHYLRGLVVSVASAP